MRVLPVLFLFLSSVQWVFSQDSTSVESPKIVARLKVGNTTNFGSKGIKFIRVVEDSRCPTGVDCIWPGEVKALIGFYKNTTLIEEKEFVFGVKAINSDQIKELLITAEKMIYAYDISPYPSSEKPIDPTHYYLELLIK